MQSDNTLKRNLLLQPMKVLFMIDFFTRAADQSEQRANKDTAYWLGLDASSLVIRAGSAREGVSPEAGLFERFAC